MAVGDPGRCCLRTAYGGAAGVLTGAEVAPAWVELYHYAGFLSAGVAFLSYAALVTLTYRSASCQRK